MSILEHDGLRFHYHCQGRDHRQGQGQPVVFLHGLGGDMHQPRGLLEGVADLQLITLDFRAHGETRPLGAPEKIAIFQFADDVRALLDHLSLETCVLGGISLGAAVALSFALQYSERLSGLILVRPAWLTGPNPLNARIYSEIARQIREHGAAQGKSNFAQSADYQEILNQSTDAASSLLRQFDGPRAAQVVCRLERLPTDKVVEHLSELSGLQVKTLVLANRRDPIHPFSYGEALATALPDARFAEVTPKSDDLDRHAADVRRFVSEFVHLLSTELPLQC